MATYLKNDGTIEAPPKATHVAPRSTYSAWRSAQAGFETTERVKSGAKEGSTNSPTSPAPPSLSDLRVGRVWFRGYVIWLLIKRLRFCSRKKTTSHGIRVPNMILRRGRDSPDVTHSSLESKVAAGHSTSGGLLKSCLTANPPSSAWDVICPRAPHLYLGGGSRRRCPVAANGGGRARDAAGA